MYVDTEEFLVAYFLASEQFENVAVEMPNSPPLPFLLITRVSGADDRITDRAIVHVDVFDSTRALASEDARQMHALILALTAKNVVEVSSGPVQIDRVETVLGPSWLTYEDENLKRYCAAYLISSRVTAQAT